MKLKGFKLFVPSAAQEPEPFNRKANYGERHRMIETLRRAGWTRRVAMKYREDSPYPNKWYHLESTAMYAFHFIDKKGKTFADLGCGYSPDSQIARLQGCAKAYRIDLYETPKWTDGTKLILADYCEELPLPSGCADFVLAQATINLCKPTDRRKMYLNVYRLLKPGGYFAFYICKLRNQWDWNLQQEIARAERVGLVVEGRFPGGAIMRKGGER